MREKNQSLETKPKMTQIITLVHMGMNTVLYYVPYVQNGRGKMIDIKQKHGRYKKDQDFCR